MLGADAISIELAGEAFELRPTLRAGMRLARRHGLGLFAAVRDFNTTVIVDVLRECGIRPALLFAEIEAHGLAVVHGRLTGPLWAFALAIAGIDPDAKPAPPATTSKQPTPEEYHSRLFEIATGWLGWSPEEAWNATIPEIIAARAGRMGLIEDVLKAVFGSTDTTANTPAPYTPEDLAEIDQLGHDPAFDREGLAALKQKVAG